MKKLYLFIALACASGYTAQAQNEVTKKADKLFEQLRYVDAAKAYEKALEKGQRTPYVYAQLADAYYLNADYKNAERNYARATKKDASAETLYRYAQTLKANEKFDLSNAIMQRFASTAPSDERAKMFTSNPNYLKDINMMEPGFTTEVFKVNTEASDFAAIQIGDQLYFSSARNEARKNYGWNKEPYLDIYQAKIDDAGIAGKPVLLQGEVNTKYHEGTLDITPDGKYMFFTRVDYYDGKYNKSKQDGESKLNIYRALKAGDEWKDIKSTSLESADYGVGHPSITKSGDMIYFASEAPGGFGGSDIYKATLKDGKIGTPVNLGSKVNTSGDDSFPFIAGNGVLYFSSNGHLGLGGLDIFKYEAGQVTNMGQPINSSMDDFAFTMDVTSGKGYYSSNRKGGSGGDDIYTAQRIDICEVLVTVKAVNAETKAAVPGAIIGLRDAAGNTFPAATADENGMATFTTDCDLDLMVSAVKATYDNGEAELSVTQDPKAMVEVMMVPDPPIVEEKILLNKIYFDLDKSNIRPDAALELDRLVKLMKKYPTLEVMAETYADIRGSDSYNLALTQRRAESIVSYVISKGVESNRLKAAGRGESNPVIDCKAQKCSKAEYELSRRSEFTITKR